jgi:hypothetical protein
MSGGAHTTAFVSRSTDLTQEDNSTGHVHIFDHPILISAVLLCESYCFGIEGPLCLSAAAGAVVKSRIELSKNAVETYLSITASAQLDFGRAYSTFF